MIIIISEVSLGGNAKIGNGCASSDKAKRRKFNAFIFSGKKGLIAILTFAMLFLVGCGLFPASYSLTVELEGEGTVAPGEGTHTYEEDTFVDVEAEPKEGWEFSHK